MFADENNVARGTFRNEILIFLEIEPSSSACDSTNQPATTSPDAPPMAGTTREIIRCFKLFLAREIYQRVMTDFRRRQAVTQAA